MTEEIQLQTKRLLLRSIRLDDSGPLFHYRADAMVNRYQGWIPATIEDVHDFISNKATSEVNVEGTWHQLVMIKKEDSRLIGDIGIHFLNSATRCVEIGCTLDKDHQGKGYAQEALTATIEYLFDSLEKRIIIAHIDPRNERSIRMVERLGFRAQSQDGEFGVNNTHDTDDVVFTIDSTMWPVSSRHP